MILFKAALWLWFIPHREWPSEFSFGEQPILDVQEGWPHRLIGTTLPDVELTVCFADRQSC